MRGKLSVLFWFFTYFFSLFADYLDSEDAIYLTTMDTPVVGSASACFKQHVTTLVCLQRSEYPSPCKTWHRDESTCVSRNSVLVMH